MNKFCLGGALGLLNCQNSVTRVAAGLEWGKSVVTWGVGGNSEVLLLYGFPACFVGKYVLQSVFMACSYRQNGRSLVRPSYVGLTACSIPADHAHVCVRSDIVDSVFHLSGSAVLFVRPAVSFLQSLPSDKEGMPCSSWKRGAVRTADTSGEGGTVVMLL